MSSNGSQRPTCRSRLIRGIVLLVVLQNSQPVWAWGRLGHRVISRIAEKHLSPTAKNSIKELLAEGETLADASTWADEYRGSVAEPRHGTTSTSR